MPNPAMIRSDDCAIVCKPDEQKRLTVVPGMLSGSPAAIAATRATLKPCSPSGIAQPRTTSSISSGESFPATCATTALIAAAAISSGRVVRNVPRGALPTAVRAPATMTASLTIVPSM